MAKFKVYYTIELNEVATHIFEQNGFEVKVCSHNDEETYVKELAEYQPDGIMCRTEPITAKMMDTCKNLKVIGKQGAGLDNIDMDHAAEKDIQVVFAPAGNANAVAELAVAMMIFMCRTQFTPATGSEVQGKRLGIQAFGNVGRLVGAKAKGLGMEVIALDPFLTPEQIEAGGARPVTDLGELYANSDFVSIHIPALPSTIKSIGYDLITKMPKGATLVNTARKEVIDEEGLMRALEERPDLKYVTDVMPDNYAALQEKFGLRVFATPKKMGAQTAEANMNAGLAAARQIVDFFVTGNTRFQVNK